MLDSAAASDAGTDAPNSRDFTVRATIAGLGLGAVLSIGNVYMGLKLGWSDDRTREEVREFHAGLEREERLLQSARDRAARMAG